MEMRAIEDIAGGRDLTPPLPPVAFVLRDSALTSHCSACFSTLPPHPFPPCKPNSPQNPCHGSGKASTPLYCSPHCSSLDSPLHFSSAESQLYSLLHQSTPLWEDSSDLRLTLRLLYIFQKFHEEYGGLAKFPVSVIGDQSSLLGGEKDYLFQGNDDTKRADENAENREKSCQNMESVSQNDGVRERIGGLMTNRERLMFGENRNGQFQGVDDVESVVKRIQEEAELVAKARRLCVDEDVNAETQKDCLIEEMILCLVMTNAVEVQDESGCGIGVAVYGKAFSWINHSCSPNACYRFSLAMEHDERQPPLRITSATKSSGCGNGNGKGLMMEGDMAFPFSERNVYGPRVIVRNIKAVSRGEEVTIAYTDLLQPKEMRRAELWSKYQFSCSCQRCGSVDTDYVDYALQALSTANIDCPKSPDNTIEEMMQSIDGTIDDYLTFGDPQSCCEKLENLLSHGHSSDDSVEPKEAKSPPTLKLLHPFHYHCQNAYTTLASAYRVLASDLLALDHEVEKHKLDAFNMYKTSAAYSLFLAGVVHHLYMFESALVTSAAKFFISAGESFLTLARSSSWNSILKSGPIRQELSSFSTHKCNRCCLASTFNPNSVSPDQNLQLQEVKIQLFNCIADITSKVWTTVASESSFLKLIKNPIDLSWIASPEPGMTPDFKSSSSPLEDDACNAQVRRYIILLSIHCLRYGELLSSICYGFLAEMNWYKILESLEESDCTNTLDICF